MLAFVAADRRSPVLAGIALGCRHAGQIFPVVAGPSLYQRWDWRLPVAFVATVARALPAVSRRRHQGVRLSRPIRHRGAHRPGLGDFPLAACSAASCRSRATPSRYYFPAAAADHDRARACVGLARTQRPGADLWGAMVLAVTFLVLFSPHYAWYFAWLVPFLCFYPSVARPLSDLRGQLALTSAHWPPHLSDGLVLYGALLLILLAELCFRRYRREGGAPCRRCPRLRSIRAAISRASASARDDRAQRASGLRLSGDDQPLQSAVHDVPAHLRGARAARRHELGACSPRSSTRFPISSARSCTASASRCWSRTCRAWCAISRTAAPTCCSTPTAPCSTRRTAAP